MMYELTRDPYYLQILDLTLDYFFYDAPKTPQGLVFLDVWGSLR